MSFYNPLDSFFWMAEFLKAPPFSEKHFDTLIKCLTEMYYFESRTRWNGKFQILCLSARTQSVPWLFHIFPWDWAGSYTMTSPFLFLLSFILPQTVRRREWQKTLIHGSLSNRSIVWPLFCFLSHLLLCSHAWTGLVTLIWKSNWLD